jgi:pyruvate formate lyase activating enzyme
MTRGIIFDIKKFAIHDGPGIRTTVFLKGCPLKCLWCHNPESQQLTPQTIFHAGNEVRFGSETTPKEVLDVVLQDQVFYDESGGGVTFSGGEPLMQFDFLRECTELCHNQGLHVALDTTGYAPWEKMKQILPFVDLFLYDVKIVDPHIHRWVTGVSNELILGNLEKLVQTEKQIYIRIPIIPTITDTPANLSDLRAYLTRIKGFSQINILPYNELGLHKYEQLQQPYRLSGISPPTQSQMEEIQRIFKEITPYVLIGG